MGPARAGFPGFQPGLRSDRVYTECEPILSAVSTVDEQFILSSLLIIHDKACSLELQAWGLLLKTSISEVFLSCEEPGRLACPYPHEKSSGASLELFF